MYTIYKEFHFSYGHRVWTQSLNAELSLDTACVCKHLHGHNSTVKVYLEANELVNGFVTDFKHLNWFKKWVDDVLDHKMVMDINDPALTLVFPKLTDVYNSLSKAPGEQYCLVSPEVFKKIESIHERELYEGLVVVDFVPTSELLANWMFKKVKEKMEPFGIKVKKIEFTETPKTQSTYEE